MTRSFASLILLFCVLFNYAQSNSQPKVAVVLSGGGAKGLAHIGVLKALEDVGIYPDMITGNSMGSVVGGLYASGYTADEIAELARKIDWEQLLSNKIPLSKVAFEEKAYYSRYIGEFPVVNNIPQLPQGMIEGQKLHEELSSFTSKVHDIRNFDELPIPYRAVATDIATGERVVLKSGSLPTAIRASMAIPTVFTPVEINDTLLVDGGLVRNFPVQEALDMGADFVIGIFVSTDLDPKEELQDMIDILMQATWVMSAYDSREQRKLVDIYVAPELADFSTMSFDQADSIIARGYETGAIFKNRFQALKDSLSSAGKVFKKPERKQGTDTLTIGSIAVEGNKAISKDFILGKLNLHSGDQVPITDLNRRIERVYGTGYFKKVDYEILRKANATDLLINVLEVEQTFLKVALHYNNESRAGLNVNLTARNKLLDNSRFITEIDIAENPRLDISYLKYAGINQRFALTTALSLWRFELPTYSNAEQLASFRYLRRSASLTIQNTRSQTSSGGITIRGFLNSFRPSITDRLRFIEKGKEESIDLSAFWAINSNDKVFFPTRGIKGQIKIGYVPYNQLKITATDTASNTVTGSSTLEEFGYADLQLEYRIPVSRKLTLFYSANFLSTTNNEPGLNYSGALGGFFQNYSFTVPFWGAEFYEFDPSSYGMLSAGFQWELFPAFYLTAKANYLDTEYPASWLLDDHTPAELRGEFRIYGGGVSLGYESIMGPIIVSVGKASGSSKWLFGINLGFWF